MYAAPVHGVQSKAARPRRFPEKWFLGGLSANQKRTHHLCDVCVFYAAALYARSSAADSGCPCERQHIDVVVVVPVVKAEHDGLFRQRRTVAHIGDDVRHDDGRVAIFRQPPEVGFQLPRLDGILAGLVGLDLVVHDDRQRHGVRLLPGGIGRKRAEHEQRRQHDGHHPLRDRQRSAHGIHLLSFHPFGDSLRRARENHARAARFAAARCTHLTPSTIGSTRNASPIATAYSAAEMGVKSKALAKNGT